MIRKFTAIFFPRSAFSLVELVIVIVIIGIIAAIAVPRFSSATDVAIAKQIAADVKVMNNAVELYKADHNGKSPADGLQGKDGATYIDRLIQTTDSEGNLSENGQMGPYLRSFPTNPFLTTSVTVHIKQSDTPPPYFAPTYHWVVYKISGTINLNQNALGGYTVEQLTQLTSPAMFEYPP